MPLIIDRDLPSKKILEKENIFIMDSTRALTQDIRPLRLAIVNLMPNKEETEIQLLRNLSNTPLQVSIDLINTSSYQAKNTQASYLKKYYRDFADIKNEKYDGMIITGAPVEHLSFEEVKYWPELKEIFEFARTNVYSTLFICWASQAALYYYYDIEKVMVDKKIFGIYEYPLLSQSPLTKGFDDHFYMPQSRHSMNRMEDLAKIEDLQIIGGHLETGASLVSSVDQRFVFIAGHSEYDKDTLHQEYIRDINKGLPQEKPINYYRDNDPDKGVLVTWRSHANLLFTNWLNHFVYQKTPFDINQITQKKVSKFGGSSLSDAQQFKKVKDIVQNDASRNLIVVSAPGKRHEKDAKVTDLLAKYFLNKDKEILKTIQKRYKDIVYELDLDASFHLLIKETITSIQFAKNVAYVLSRGEFLSAKILAAYLDYRFIDAAELVFFDEKGELDRLKTEAQIKARISPEDKVVVPGFYGLSFEGEIKTFKCGGSDITGSIFASVLQFDVYENWTDVDGLMDKNPQKFKDAKLIDSCSYETLLAVIAQDCEVYHMDAIEPIMACNIPLNIRNTNKPNRLGTLIQN